MATKKLINLALQGGGCPFHAEPPRAVRPGQPR
jgi:hypothetical protein